MNKFIGESHFSHEQTLSTGLLVLNLGTPDAPTSSALRKYLRQFLSDSRVIEIPKLKWWFILNAFVLPFRPRKSAQMYKRIWTEKGSPLLINTEEQTNALRSYLQEHTSSPIVVEFGMRYGNPSVKSALVKLKSRGIDKLLVLPLHPQYSATTVGSCFDSVVDELKKWRWVPEFRMIMSYYASGGYIRALAQSVRDVWENDGEPEKLLISFHGIPKRYFAAGDPYHCQCQKTARLLAESLGLERERYEVCFQSRFGREEWLKPYTDETLEVLGSSGTKSIDVICPGFAADCLETLDEIALESRHVFLNAGGEKFRYIPALNSREDFIHALGSITKSHLQGWVDDTLLERSNCHYLGL